MHVFSCHDFNLSSGKCKLSLNKYKISSKIIIIFRFVAESVLQNMAYICHIEIILSSVEETYFCCTISTISTMKTIWLCCSVSTRFFYVTSSESLFETMWGHLRFFSCAFDATNCIERARKMLQVASEFYCFSCV